MKPPDFSRLRSSLVKIGLLVGLDETTPLKPINKEPGCRLLDYINYQYDEQLLFAVSGNVVAQTTECPATNSSNSSSNSSSSNDVNGSGSGDSSTTATGANTTGDGQAPSATPSLSQDTFSDLYNKPAVAVPPVTQCWVRSDCLETVRPVSMEKPLMPVDWDIIGTLGIFCCPNGISIFRHRPDPHCHALVLTDLTGMRFYGSCLTFYRPFQLRMVDPTSPGSPSDQPSQPIVRLQPCSEHDGTRTNPVIYVPTCVCLVSESAYHTVLKDCLSRLLPSLVAARTCNELQRMLSDFVAHLALVPTPPSGPLVLSFTSCGRKYACSAPEHGRPILDMNLNYPFNFFSKEIILQLITCLLTEQRIIFVSSSPSACVMVMECLLSYILPFVWRQHYVPILPRRLVGLTGAPGQFVMGVHPSLLDEIESDGDIVFAYLDSGTVDIPDSLQLPPLPAASALSFMERLNEPNWTYNRLSDMPSPATLEEEAAARTKHQEQINSEIKEACFLLLASMFCSMDDFITNDGKRLQFNKAQFIKKRPDTEKPFYSLVCHSSMFGFFQEDKTMGRSDFFWRDIPTWRRATIRMSAHGTRSGSIELDIGSPLLTSHHNRRKSLSVLSLRRHTSTAELSDTLQLPLFEAARHSSASAYHKECIAVVTRHLDSLALAQTEDDMATKLPNLRSAYLQVRGMLYDACGLTLKALHDFDDMVVMFPKSVARTLFSQLKEEERESFTAACPGFQRKIEGPKDDRPQPSADNPLRSAIDNMKFPSVMQQLGILDNADASSRLFRILQRRPGHSLPPATVQSLFHEWQEFAPNTLNGVAVTADSVEVDLFTSSGIVRSSLGLGRLVLTTRSILLVVNERRHVLVDLHRVSRVEKYRLRERLSIIQVNAVRFIIEGEEVSQAAYVCLREDRDLWYDITTEMTEGIRSSKDLNYPQVIKFAAQNVLVYIALTRLHYPASDESGLPLDKTSRGMLYYTTQKLPKLPMDISRALVQRFNPSEQDAAVATVECLHYVPPLSNYDDDCGRLWCGMGNTKCVKVLNAETFLLEFDVRCENRVNTLLHVASHMWIGCQDKSITVVEADNGQSVASFVLHEDMVTSLILGANGMVWSASVNGQVMIWDPRRIRQANSVTLPPGSQVNCLVAHNGWIWCSGKEELVLIREDNVQVQKVIRVANSNRLTSMAVSSIGEVWVGGSRSKVVHIIDGNSHEVVDTVHISNNSDLGNFGICALMAVNDKVWAGGKNGFVYICDASTKERVKEVKAHNDGVRSMCLKNKCVVTGPGSHDGVVAMWNPTVWNV